MSSVYQPIMASDSLAAPEDNLAASMESTSTLASTSTVMSHKVTTVVKQAAPPVDIIEEYKKCCAKQRVRKPNSQFIRQVLQRDVVVVKRRLKETSLNKSAGDGDDSVVGSGGDEKEDAKSAGDDDTTNHSAPEDDNTPTKPIGDGNEETVAPDAVPPPLPSVPSTVMEDQTEPEEETYECVETRQVPPMEVTEIVLDDNYMGNRGILAICMLIRHQLHRVRKLSLRRCRFFATDGNPMSISGNATIQSICELLSGHTEIDTIDFSENELSSQAYLWIVHMVRHTASLRTIILEDTPLQEHEKMHINLLLQRKQRFPPKSKSKSPQRAHTGTSPSRPAAVGGSVRMGGSMNRLESSVNAVVRAHDAQRESAYQLEVAFREYHKNEGLHKQLRNVFCRSALYHAYRREAYPTEEGSWRKPPMYPDLPSSMQIGPTIEELDAEAKEKELVARLDREVDIMIRCLHRATFSDGELVVEAGDSAEWIHMVMAGGHLELRRGDEFVTARPGAIVGEDEILSDEGGSTRRSTITARVAEKESDRVKIEMHGKMTPVVVVWQLRREVFMKYMGKHVGAHRRAWRKYTDSLPVLLGLGPLHRGMFSDLIVDTKITEPDTAVLEKKAFFDFCVIVVEGHMSVRREDKEVKDLSQFDMFLLKPGIPVEDLELKVMSGPTKIIKLPLAQLSLLSEEVQAHILKQGRAYEAPPPPQSKYKSLGGQ